MKYQKYLFNAGDHRPKWKHCLAGKRGFATGKHTPRIEDSLSFKSFRDWILEKPEEAIKQVYLCVTKKIENLEWPVFTDAMIESVFETDGMDMLPALDLEDTWDMLNDGPTTQTD